MGGGDLNMKKSWHPLLLKNQERVWLEEQKAREEKKKLDQLRKEKEEERQLQELQRMQEEQTGKKRTEKLEWMYSTPATGSSQNQNDLEDYLLGKKRVDKILTGDENAKVGASHKNFIAVQNANTARDIAAKIREDPLLAIKQQEQAAYQALMSNPLRLRELQERNGIKPKKEKKDKKDKHGKKDKHERKREKAREDHRSASPDDRYRTRRSPSVELNGRSRHSPSYEHRRSSYDRRSRSVSPLPSRYNERKTNRDDHYSPPRRGRSRSRTPPPYRRRSISPSRSRSRSTSVDPPHRRASDRVHVRSRSEDSNSSRGPRRRSPDREDDRKRRRRTPSPDRSYPSPSKRFRHSPPPSYSSSRAPAHKPPASADRAAQLAAMTSNASQLTVDRQKRLQAMLEAEVAEAERERKARERNRDAGGFLSQEAKKVYGGMGLEERVRRGRGGMVVDAE